MQGQIVIFFRAQNYGFIHCQEQARDYFFHGSRVIGGSETIQTGDPVEFLLGDDPFGDGLVAVDVQRRPE